MTPRFQRESPYYSACRRAPRARVSGTLAELLFGLRQGLSLGIPVSCAGCGRWETALCPRCLELLEGEPFAVDHADAAGDLGILALAAYAGPVRTMVLGWKNGSREDLSETMARAGRRLGSRWARTHPPGEIWPGMPGAHPGEDPATAVVTATSMPALLVVPAPSGLARRLRGRLVAARLADDVARAIADQWAHPEWADSSVRAARAEHGSAASSGRRGASGRALLASAAGQSLRRPASSDSGDRSADRAGRRRRHHRGHPGCLCPGDRGGRRSGAGSPGDGRRSASQAQVSHGSSRDRGQRRRRGLYSAPGVREGSRRSFRRGFVRLRRSGGANG